MQTRKFLLLLAFGLSACKTPRATNTADLASMADAAEQTSTDRAKSLHQSIVTDLRQQFADSENSVWFDSSANVDGDWLIQSPDGYWGRSPESLPKDLGCEAGSTGCDEQFGRHLCQSDTDCAAFNTTCQPLAASVSKPNEEPRRMCLGSGDALFDRFYRLITSAEQHVDITSLSAPSGRFYPMMINALAYLSHREPSPTIRILLAGLGSHNLNILHRAQPYVDKMVEDIGKRGGNLEKLRFDLGFLSDLHFSWNHSKIIIADGRRFTSGGINFYDPDYVEDHPVFDASVEMSGQASAGVQSFVDVLWSKVRSANWGKHPYNKLKITNAESWERIKRPNLPAPKRTENSFSLIGVGRLGTYGANPSDQSFVSLMKHAEKTIDIAQQDVFQRLPLPIVGNVQDRFKLGNPSSLPALIDAMLRGVHVRIVHSDQVAGMEGYGFMEAQETSDHIFKALLAEANKRKVQPQDGKSLEQYLCSMFEVAPWRFTTGTNRWGDGKRKIAAHPKIIAVDNSVFYIGSHNMYPADLQEFGVIVTDANMTRNLKKTYWDKVWSAASPDKAQCPAAVTSR